MNGLEQSRFAKVWKKVLSAAQGLLSPRVSACPGCNQPAVLNTRQMGLCQICYTGIPWIREVICPICGRYEECGDCLRREETCFIRNRSAVRYDESMKELLARYKYRGDEQLSSLFGEMLLFAYFLHQEENRNLAASKASPPRVLTYVPLSGQRLLERGFNQAEQMAKALGKNLELPVVPLLVRSRHTDKQSQKTRSGRLEDVQGLFELDERVCSLMPASFRSGFDLYLVDDVYTTGSTMNECAKVLRAGLPARVFGLTWAR
ncbi:DNA transport apparatus-associated-like protein [Paenibacillus larvae subsp. larvae]|uniref:DNA transport apparatus-associated-like protein n=1 Tax=Paenibacillus larvae subsp. larvae TaxID=147375 RepID=A0A2L1U852_9BACL|nr:ComF family protein [Paenibacillus larvae]AQT85080.1 hypothetical protein B1222_12865 [Paenibacillus larvae subsp. pulvifaciens]AQZ47085.1 hypothetical protein B5S25_11295 [Paenibacillus larvae subsp. pulvifaciens]AVF24363.1 DNA transport apparatus-associated-like protein [Paenibacillus larvae subsp. larvae]AVF29124.1 DNA transport apparatus-associated-like protein [Paenibacillus larvae subsp. larvae]MBH0341335.1 hypothetical protein [Paenibacillus larvae]